MRDAERVYLVGTDPYGSHQGSTTVTMRLLRGNEVMEVDDVLYVETDQESLEAAWEENLDMLEEAGVRLLEVTDEEAEELYLRRMGDDEDEEEDCILEERTETGWRLSLEDGSVLAEFTGTTTEGGTWKTQHAQGSYEAFTDWQGKRMVRFQDEAGEVVDVVPADEDLFRVTWLWGLGRQPKVQEG